MGNFNLQSIRQQCHRVIQNKCYFIKTEPTSFKQFFQSGNIFIYLRVCT